MQHVSLGRVVFGFVLFFSLLLYSSGTLKILGGIPLQTHARSAKRLQYLKQTLAESESIKSQSNDGLVAVQL